MISLYEIIQLLRYSRYNIRIKLLEGCEEVTDSQELLHAGQLLIDDFQETIQYGYVNGFLDLDAFKVDSIIYDYARDAYTIFVRMR